MVLAPTATGTVPFTLNAPAGITVDAIDLGINNVNSLGINSNNNPFLYVNSITYPLTKTTAPITFRIATGQGDQHASINPLHFTIDGGVNSGDQLPIWGIQVDSLQCGSGTAFGLRYDGDGFAVFYGGCSLALDNTLTEIFGESIFNGQIATSVPSLLVDGNTAKTGGAAVVTLKDESHTIGFNLPDGLTKSNPPQFPVGLASSGMIATGTQTISGCSLTVPLGGSWAGSFKSGTTGTCTVTITPGITANGFACFAKDLTNPADEPKQTAYTTTTCTLSWTTVSGDLVTWQATAF